MLDDHAAVIQQHNAFVAEYDHDIVGVLILIQTQSRILLDNVAIHPEHQGKGVGRHLLEFAESQALRHGFNNLELYTHECMTENIAMYKRMGYVATARRTERGYDRVYMQKALAHGNAPP